MLEVQYYPCIGRGARSLSDKRISSRTLGSVTAFPNRATSSSLDTTEDDIDRVHIRRLLLPPRMTSTEGTSVGYQSLGYGSVITFDDTRALVDCPKSSGGTRDLCDRYAHFIPQTGLPEHTVTGFPNRATSSSLETTDDNVDRGHISGIPVVGIGITDRLR